LLIGHHPGYISWEEYLENKQRLEANVALYEGEGSGAAKLGTALLSGCCAAAAAAGNCKLSIAAPAAVCRATFVGAIEGIANPADA
jgi:hypothetical protein